MYYKMVPNIVVDSNATPLLDVDDVEHVQRQSIASLIGHVSQFTYTAMVDVSVLSTITYIIHSKHFSVSDWLKSHA